MLFCSFEFIFLFFPLTLLGYYVAGKYGKKTLPQFVLVVASLFFYAFWKLGYLPVLLVSLAINFCCGRALTTIDTERRRLRKIICCAAIAINVGLIGFFKYAGFIFENVYALLPADVPFLFDYALPLGISFFTFQQIAYIIDVYKTPDTKYSLLDYSLFVTFFPQLIAGPIVHHSEVMPQFGKTVDREKRWQNFAGGTHLFIIGLFKKIVIADTMAQWANAGFDNPTSLDFAHAWGVSLAYTFQLYFDFSGYCDMAIGAALFFNIHLPINFNSPYKAQSIQDFWRRWHMTLSRWLRDYVYIPLGGSRCKESRVYFNILLTFFVAGIWHGAGWTFILWGLIHGAALAVHRLWTYLGKSMPSLPACLLTFVFINFAWVLFRAESIGDAMTIYEAMLGFGTVSMGGGVPFDLSGTQVDMLTSLANMAGYNSPILPLCLLLLGAVSFLAPNSQRLVKGIFESSTCSWGEAALRGLSLTVLFGVSLICMMAFLSTEFMYFNF